MFPAVCPPLPKFKMTIPLSVLLLVKSAVLTFETLRPVKEEFSKEKRTLKS